MKKYDYLIVGAGLFGASLAYFLRNNGYNVYVVEKEPYVGGMCHTVYDCDITVHEFGAHIFRTDDEELWKFVNSISPFKPFINSPLANVDGRLYNLPFNMNTFQQIWGVTTPREAKKKILEDIIPNDNPQNLEEFALSKVGKSIYYMFIKDYTEKQWGKQCKDLPASILGRLPLRFTYDNNYYANKPYQGIPVRGYTEFIEQLLGDSSVELATEFDKDRHPQLAEKIIYTGSIDEYFDYRYGRLDYRSLRFRTEYLSDTEDYQGNAVINYPTLEQEFTRSIEHKHFLGEESPTTIISYEYPTIYDGTNTRYYPIETADNLMLYNRYASIDTDVIFAGRLGQYKYTDMEQTIINARNLATRLDICE